MYESIEEARMYNFYENEVMQEGVVDALKKFVNKLKEAIIKFIDKLDKMIGEVGDSKLKQGLKKVLTKAKSLLTKTDKISTKEEAKECKDEFKELKEEVDNVEDEVLGELKADLNKMEIKYFDPDQFYNHIKNNDTVWVKNELVNYARNNDMKAFDLLIDCLKKYKPEYFEKYIAYKNDNIIDSKDEWDRKYLISQTFFMEENFSDERINRVRDILKYRKEHPDQFKYNK